MKNLKDIDLSQLIPADATAHENWILQISSEMLALWQKDFLELGSLPSQYKLRKLSKDFIILEFNQSVSPAQLQKTIFPRWLSPIEHQWPVNPTTEGFVEKASQGLMRRFSGRCQEIDVFATTVRLKSVAKGLKGRLHQVFSQNSQTKGSPTNSKTATQSNGILSVVIDEKGLFAGISLSRLQTGTALVGGLGFLSMQNSPANKLDAHSEDSHSTGTTRRQMTSRAGGKIKEVLSLLKEIAIDAQTYPRWIELGASPGGMTQQLIHWGAHVTAVDLAELVPELKQHPKVVHLKIHAQEISTAEGFEALLSDMNGPFENAARIVSRIAQTLPSGGLVIHILKLNNSPNPRNALNSVMEQFTKHNLTVVTVKHLFHNRQEFTLICRRN